MRRFISLCFIAGAPLLIFVLIFGLKKHYLPATAPGQAAPAVGPVALQTPVTVSYAKGNTEIRDLKGGAKYFNNRANIVLKLNPELAGLKFTFRAAGQPSNATLIVPGGATVYLLIGSDHGGAAAEKGLRQLHQTLASSGWTRLTDDSVVEPWQKNSLLAGYKRSFSALTRLTIPGAGAAGIVVAARQLALPGDHPTTASVPPPATISRRQTSAGIDWGAVFHHPITYFILLFGAIFTWSLIYQILVSLGLASGRLGDAARQAERRRMNMGWRIELIPSDVDGRSYSTSRNGSLTFVSSLGGIGFLGGVLCLLMGNVTLAVGLIASSMAVVILGLLVRAGNVRQMVGSWQVTSARCVDRELRRVFISRRSRGRRWGYMWRIVCEFTFGGRNYRVTPMIRPDRLGYSDKAFQSEEAANQFLAEAIDSANNCQLRVNPENPLETQVFQKMS